MQFSRVSMPAMPLHLERVLQKNCSLGVLAWQQFCDVFEVMETLHLFQNSLLSCMECLGLVFLFLLYK